MYRDNEGVSNLLDRLARAFILNNHFKPLITLDIKYPVIRDSFPFSSPVWSCASDRTVKTLETDTTPLEIEATHRQQLYSNKKSIRSESIHEIRLRRNETLDLSEQGETLQQLFVFEFDPTAKVVFPQRFQIQYTRLEDLEEHQIFSRLVYEIRKQGCTVYEFEFERGLCFPITFEHLPKLKLLID